MKIFKSIVTFALALTMLSAPLSGFSNDVSADEISGMTPVSKNVLADKYLSGAVQDDGFSIILNKGDGSVDEQTFWSRMATKFYYNKLDSTEKALYDRYFSSVNYYLMNDVDIADYIYINIDGLNFNRDTMEKVFDIFRASNPQFFFITYIGISSISSSRVESVGVKALDSYMKGSARAAAKQQIKTAVNNYLNAAASCYNPEEKEHQIFELMCSNISFNSKVDDSGNIYGAVKGQAGNWGYSLLFEALMNSLGIDCMYVYGMGPNSNRYMRNLINLHGYWYAVDVSMADQETKKYKYYNYREIMDGNIDPTIFDYVFEMWIRDGLYEDDVYSSRYFTYQNVTYFIVSDGDYGYQALPLNESLALPRSASSGKRTYSVIRPEGLKWVYENDQWFYLNDNNLYVRGWQKIDGNWYYFDYYMYKGLRSVGDYLYYFGNNGVMRTGWQFVSGNWYYFGSDGIAKDGWVKIDGSWYFFGNNVMICSEWGIFGDDWYYFASNGKMSIGWQKIDGKWYYFQSSGIMAKGWQQISGNWYYFGDSGKMRTGWEKINGKWYFFGDSGVMRIGWAQANGKWYYFESSGAMKTGWLKLGGYWFYLDPSSGAMTTGSRTIGGKTYKFDSSGKCTNP